MNTNDNISAADKLAGLVTGNASMTFAAASVQRSHRFPMHVFIEIENLAKLGGIPVSLVINQLLEAGLEAVRNKLPRDVMVKATKVSTEQLDRFTQSLQGDAPKVRKTAVRRTKQAK